MRYNATQFPDQAYEIVSLFKMNIKVYANLVCLVKKKKFKMRPNFIYKCDIMRHNFQAKHMKLYRAKQFHIPIYFILKSDTIFASHYYSIVRFTTL